ncbi:DUF3768 domain-containing protein [Aureimonas sp. AU4]|uniref:DUF3768 domain-containing protein n=1 Tax=Aureimonas sp. AU4 TaxID=1638163 RepID=UPI000783BD29|nr:DUF3768 domain-containing protein [Aureimonas sp. AU4]
MQTLVVTTRDRVRTLNDQLRQQQTGGTIVTTPGVRALGAAAVAATLRAVAAFDDFGAHNDPFDEHEFGSVVIEGQTVWFKVEAYDLDMRWHSPDPADPAVTHRIMTLMLPEEY